MKKTISLFVAGVFCLLLGGGFTASEQKQISAPQKHALEALARNIVKTLNKQDYNAYAEMLITKEDLEKIYARTQDAGTEEYYHLQEINRTHAEMCRRDLNSFVNVISRGMELEVNWSEVRYESCSFEMLAKRLDNRETAGLTIRILYKGKQQTLSCRQVICMGKDWKIADRLEYMPLSSKDLLKLEEDMKLAMDSIMSKAFETTLADTTLLATDSVLQGLDAVEETNSLRVTDSLLMVIDLYKDSLNVSRAAARGMKATTNAPKQHKINGK